MSTLSRKGKESTASFSCPSCDRSSLESIRGEVKYQCGYCDEIVHVTTVARANGIADLAEDADHVGWIAEAVCDLEE